MATNPADSKHEIRLLQLLTKLPSFLPHLLFARNKESCKEKWSELENRKYYFPPMFFFILTVSGILKESYRTLIDQKKTKKKQSFV